MLFWVPDGSVFGYPVEWLRHSPFADFRIPGLVLFVVVGGGTLAALWGLLARRSWAAEAKLRRDLRRGVLDEFDIRVRQEFEGQGIGVVSFEDDAFDANV